MGLLVAGKLLNVQVPFFYKYTGAFRRVCRRPRDALLLGVMRRMHVQSGLMYLSLSLSDTRARARAHTRTHARSQSLVPQQWMR